MRAVVSMDRRGGRLCCTIRGDLTKTSREAAGGVVRESEIWLDRVVIETTGLADPVGSSAP